MHEWDNQLSKVKIGENEQTILFSNLKEFDSDVKGNLDKIFSTSRTYGFCIP